MKNILPQSTVNHINFECERLGITEYTINSDGSIDVHQTVTLQGTPMEKFPIKFNKINGHFNCYSIGLTTLENGPVIVTEGVDFSYNRLTTLIGCPKIIGQDFDFSNNILTSLKSDLQELGGSYNCSFNNLKSLRHSPEVIHGFFDCSNTAIKSLEFAPHTIEDVFFCDDNYLTSLKFAPKKVGGDFLCTGNELTTLEDAPSDVGGFSCFNNKKLPQYLLDTFARLTYEIPIFLKYQNQYDVWTNGFSQENMDDLIEEIQDGLR